MVLAKVMTMVMRMGMTMVMTMDMTIVMTMNMTMAMTMVTTMATTAVIKMVMTMMVTMVMTMVMTIHFRDSYVRTSSHVPTTTGANEMGDSPRQRGVTERTSAAMVGKLNSATADSPPTIITVHVHMHSFRCYQTCCWQLCCYSWQPRCYSTEFP